MMIVDSERLIRDALLEDLPNGCDCTSDYFLPTDVEADGWIEARTTAVVSGLNLCAQVFKQVDSAIHLHALVEEGAHVAPLQRVLEIRGPAPSVLRAERTALNFLCHLSGVATSTREYVDDVQPWGTKILCTRKTTPGLREAEIVAVRHGGGDVFRTNLSDAVLLKDNHEGILGGLSGVQARLNAMIGNDPAFAKNILANGKIEVNSLEDLDIAVHMGWQQILLDNFSTAAAAAAVKRWGSDVFLEISGGVNRSNLRDYAATGVQAISIGAITHSAKAADFSLEVEWRRA